MNPHAHACARAHNPMPVHKCCLLRLVMMLMMNDDAGPHSHKNT
jgi:hypothetical protein